MRQSQVYRLCFSASTGLLLLACQMQAPLAVPQTAPQAAAQLNLQPQTGLQARLGGAAAPVSLKQEVLKVSEVQVKDQGNQQAQISVTLQLNRPEAVSPEGFRTQALDAGKITRLWAGIRGIGIDINSPILASEADMDGYITPGSDSFTLTFSGVPYGAVRTLFVGFHDNAGLIAPGAYLSAGFALDSATKNIELSFRTTPMGEILNTLRKMHLPPFESGTEQENTYLLSQINLADLQTLVDTLTGVSGTAPNYEYNTHPAFVHVEVIATDLKTANGDVSTLNAANPAYKHSPATVTFNLAGLIGDDKATVVVRDPASKAVTDLGNGSGSISDILGHSAPEDRWVFEVHAPGYTSHTQEIHVSAGQTLELGTITLSVASAPVISSINPSSGSIGTQVTLSGSSFHPSTAGNIVRFGSTQATVISASATELVVSVPNAASGNITVQVGDQTSNGLAFNVLPTVALTAPATDAVLSGTSTLSVSTSSGNAISKVEYFSGATKLGESISAPYSFDWDTSTSTSGAHSLTAKITDAASNEVSSAAISVTVNQLPVIADLTSSISPLYANHPTQLHCDASDAEGTPTISWGTLGGEHGSFSSSTDSLVYWTAPATGGDYTVRCSVSDGTHTVTQDLVLSVVSGTGSVTGNGGLY